MDKHYGRLYSFFLLLALISGAFFLSAGAGHAQPCLVQMTKVAEGGEGLRFDFLVEFAGGTGFAEFFGGQTVVVNISSGEDITLTELPNPGWVLAERSCEATSAGIEVTEIEDGVIFNCSQAIEGVVQAECTFVNVSTAANIPTLSEWGMIAAAAGLGIVGVFFVLRRRAVRV